MAKGSGRGRRYCRLYEKEVGAGGFKIWMVRGADFLDVFMKEGFINELIITISVRLRLPLLKLHNLNVMAK